MKPTPAQEAQMRKVAFYVGVARYLHVNGDKKPITKVASPLDDITRLGTIAAVGIPVLSYVAGRHVGRFAGGLHGNATTPSAATVQGREYDLASASTQRLIDELNAEKINKTVASTIDEPSEEEQAKKKLTTSAFAKPSLLRYGK